MVALLQEEEEEEPPSNEEEEASAPFQAGFGMEDTLAEFELGQVKEAWEQQATLDSIHSEAEMEANRRFLHEADMGREELFATRRTCRSFARPSMTMRSAALARTSSTSPMTRTSSVDGSC